MIRRVKEWIKARPRVHRVARLALSLARATLPLPGGLRFAWVAAFGRGATGTDARQARHRIVMLVISEGHHDPRVERGARALAAAGFEVHIVYPDYSGCVPGVPPMDWGPGITFRSLPATAGAYILRLPYVLGSRLLKAAREEPAFAYHCHDLSTCIVGLEAARRTGACCVCDFHEWYSENVTWDAVEQRYIAHPWYVRDAYRWAERRVMRQATEVVTVSDSIARSLEAAHENRRTVRVIRNIAPLPDQDPSAGEDLRARLGLGRESFLLLYQGGTGPSRYLEPIIDAMAQLPEVVFVIRGPGIERAEPSYRQRARSAGVSERVICLEPVPSARVVAETASADAGIWTLPDLCANFRFALPNKIFEYLAARLPVLAAGYPEARKIVEGYEVGLCFDPDSPDSIAHAVRRLIDDPALRARCRANIPRCLTENDGRAEWDKLVRLYRDLAATKRV